MNISSLVSPRPEFWWHCIYMYDCHNRTVVVVVVIVVVVPRASAAMPW